MEFFNMMRLRILLPAAIVAFLWLQRSRLQKFFHNVKKGGFAVTHSLFMSVPYTARILCVANEIARGKYDGEIMDHGPDALLPEKEIWDFKLGDVVRIQYSKEDFKSIQEKIVAYNCQSEAAVGRVGIVTTVYSIYANIVTVYFPEMQRAFEIYPGVLEKVDDGLPSAAHSQKWKIGTYVQTRINIAVLSHLQQICYSVPIPKQYVGKKGKVIGSCGDFTLVEFGGTTGYLVHDSTMSACVDQSPILRENFSHPRNFKIGDKVRIISNMKTLIKNQKAIRSWNAKISCLRNREVTVVYILENGGLAVQVKNGRPWVVDPNSILKDNEKEVSNDAGIKVVPGDIVEIDFFPDWLLKKSAIDTANLLGHPECIELLRIRGKVSEINESFMVKVKFAQQLFTWFLPSTLKKVSPEKAERYRLMEKRIRNLKVGDIVRLDVGPVNFVLAVLTKLHARQNVRMALTKPATLLGFVDTVTAVIQYEDDSKYCIPKKFLTVPEKYSINDEDEPITAYTIDRIQNKVSEGLKNIDSSNKGSVLICHVAEGNPPYIVLRITSENVTWQSLSSWLQTNSGWDIEVICDKLLYISGIEQFKGEVKLGFVFQGEDLRIQQIEGFSAEGAAPVDVKAIPFQEVDDPGHPIPDGHIGGNFHFMRLYDPSLGRDLYFPYVIHGPPRNPAPVQRENQVSSIMRHVSAIFNMQHSRIGSVTNINEQYGNPATPGGQVIVEQEANNGTFV